MVVVLAVAFRIASNAVFAEVTSFGTLKSNGLQINLVAIATATQLDKIGVSSGGLFVSVQ
tara:strand:- start:122 stop:301 length:180 start_codon:yes stop_codon:yes gene_type:complete